MPRGSLLASAPILHASSGAAIVEVMLLHLLLLSPAAALASTGVAMMTYYVMGWRGQIASGNE